MSPTGNDANPGTQAAPKLTVPAAITEANDIGALDVYLAGGTYAGPIHPSGNMTIWGGFTASFARSDASADKAVLTGGRCGHRPVRTVFVLDFGGTMSLVRLTIEGPDATDPGATSYGVVVRNSVVIIKKSTILAGDGADGSDGDDGQDAATGTTATLAMKGGDGGAANELNAACDITSHGGGGSAGTNSGAPAAGSSAGGQGGAGGEMDTSCFSVRATTATPPRVTTGPTEARPQVPAADSGPARRPTPAWARTVPAETANRASSQMAPLGLVPRAAP